MHSETSDDDDDIVGQDCWPKASLPPPPYSSYLLVLGLSRWSLGHLFPPVALRCQPRGIAGIARAAGGVATCRLPLHMVHREKKYKFVDFFKEICIKKTR